MSRQAGYHISREHAETMKAKRDAWLDAHQRNNRGARTVRPPGDPQSIQELATRAGLRLVGGKVG
jgi:hypothetical protein